MLASQTWLQKLCISEPQIPDGVDPQKAINDFTGGIRMAYMAIQSGTYHSPENLPLPTTIPGLLPNDATVDQWEAAIQKLVADPWSGDYPVVSAAMAAAMNSLNLITTSGNLKAIHAAIDAVNILSPLTKEPVMAFYPDLTYLQCAPGVIGQTAQMCGPGNDYFAYGTDPVTDAIIAACNAGQGPASMQPTIFFPA